MLINKHRNDKQRLLDSKNCTYSKTPEWISSIYPEDILYSFFSVPGLKDMEKFQDEYGIKASYIMKHQFDLLGSGFVEIRHGMKARGLEGIVFSEDNIDDITELFRTKHNPENFKISSLYLNKIDEDYRHIDWQRDYKSGYRWDESRWHKDIRYGHIDGPDIKAPWEIGRLQHLPVLAIAAYIDGDINKKLDGKYFDEFRNEFYDFIASNPPRFGSQWMTGMDVAIRAMNLLCGYDLFKSAGYRPDEDFCRDFAGSIYEHGRHLSKNLEWSSGMRGNHYLAGIIGLLFISAYLPVSDETSAWLAFSINELCNEINYQFLDDGGNFEASLNYHYLGTELIVYALAIIMSLPDEKTSALLSVKRSDREYINRLPANEKWEFQISDEYEIILPAQIFEKIEKIFSFSLNILKSNYKIDQIGDNDSGKIVDFSPGIEIIDARENGSSIIPRKVYNKKRISDLIRALTSNDKPDSQNADFSILNQLRLRAANKKMLRKLMEMNFHEVENSFFEYKDFGLFIKRDKNYFLSVRCGAVGQYGKGGHAHNDAMSFCLTIEDDEFIVDPGTYLYTSMAAMRNKYRATDMHNTLHVDNMEQSPISHEKSDLFWLKDFAQAKIIKTGNNIFLGEHTGYGSKHTREMNFSKSIVKIIDECNIGQHKRLLFHLAQNVGIIKMDDNKSKVILKNNTSQIEISSDNGVFDVESYNYSPEYGELVESKRLILNMNGNKNECVIKIN